VECRRPACRVSSLREYISHRYEAPVECASIAPMRAHNFWRDPLRTIITGDAPLVTTVRIKPILPTWRGSAGRESVLSDFVSFHWGD